MAARASAGPLSLPDYSRIYSDIVGFTTEVIHSWSGSGKTKTGTELANLLWKEWHLPTLYLMLSHDAIAERLDKLKDDEKDRDWAHWRRHDENCERQQFNAAGYIGHGHCTCGRPPLTAGQPTLAPIEYALPGLPDDGRPLLDEAGDFFLWIIDEIDLRRLLGQMTVSLDDVRRVGDTHPDESVRMLCGALAELMGTLRLRARLNGDRLYPPLVGLLESRGVTYQQLVDANLQSAPWLGDGGEGLPMNFPPMLVPVLLDEADSWNEGWQFNPRIHLVRTAKGPELRVWWRKDLDYGFASGLPDDESGLPPPPAFILDATADAGLLERVFSISRKLDLGTPDWPDHVHVHQWVDDLVSRSTLGLRYEHNAFSPRNKQSRQRWYSRIADALSGLPRDWTVGIITHKLIETEATGAIKAMGFSDVRSLHYGDDRGSNALEQVRVLVLLGLPIPNIDDFQEEAQAFLHDWRPLDFQWEKKEQYLEMREGLNVPVTVGGYWKEPVASYYRQKCQSGLYQALHRIRPYLVKPDDERYVLVFTNMPVPGVKVDHLLRTEERRRLDERFEKAVSVLKQQLAQRGECTVPELAGLLAAEGVDTRSVTTWIRRNAEGLAAATGARYEPGKGGRSGRFIETQAQIVY